MTNDLTQIISYRVLPLVELEGYEGLPQSLRQALGGSSHEQHFAAVEAALVGHKAEGTRVRLVALGAEDFRDLADRLNLDLVASALPAITTLQAAEMGTDDSNDYTDLHAAYDHLFAGPDADELAAQVAHDQAQEAFVAFHEILGHDKAHEAVERGHAILEEVATLVTEQAYVTITGSWKSHTISTTISIEMCGECELPHYLLNEQDQPVLGFLAASSATVVLDNEVDEAFTVCAWSFTDGQPTSMSPEAAAHVYMTTASGASLTDTEVVVAPALGV